MTTNPETPPESKSLPEGFNVKTGPAAWAEKAAKAETQAAPDSTGPDYPAVVGALQDEIAKLKDQAMRALAEAENTRRRAERDREDASKYAITNFARDLVSVADNFLRALAAVPEDLKGTDPRIDNLLGGIEATERELQKVFERFGIRKIDPQGEAFNANYHDVMFEVPNTGKSAGTIMQVVEVGYTIHDRLLRPARVGVAKADPAQPPTHTVDTSA